MADIIEYALMNAHKDFNTLPLSKVDCLIFSQLAYLEFERFVPDKQLFARGLTFSKIAEQEGFDRLFTLERTARKNLLLFNALAYSKRYGKIKINYHEDIFLPDENTQFSATTFILPDNDAVIAFRGTDSTITGWRENFNMLYTSPVPAQALSVKYLNKTARKIRGKITVTGHSKGGNLAVYSGVMCLPSIKAKIKDIVCFDSPGFSEEFVNSDSYSEAEEKIIKLVPEESMIGMLLSDTDNYHIVKSEGDGIHQHDLFLWIIEDNDFVDGEKIHTSAKLVNSTLKEWFGKLDKDEREVFVDAIFNIVERTNEQNASTFIDWSENIKKNSDLFFDTLKELDPDTKSFMLKTLTDIFPSAYETVLTTPKKMLKKTISRIKPKKS